MTRTKWLVVTAVLILFTVTHGHAFCFDSAAARYGVAPSVLRAIAYGESSNNPSAINYNKNGSHDIGLMQINSSWLPTLAKQGIRSGDLWDPCTNLMVGAWILADCFEQFGNRWQSVGCYNSRTPRIRDRYAARIQRIHARYFSEGERHVRR